jgi:hypothetical protein
LIAHKDSEFSVTYDESNIWGMYVLKCRVKQPRFFSWYILKGNLMEVRRK